MHMTAPEHGRPTRGKVQSRKFPETKISWSRRKAKKKGNPNHITDNGGSGKLGKLMSFLTRETLKENMLVILDVCGGEPSE